MTDWIAQTQAGVDRWLETQRQWWDAILGGGPSQPGGGLGPGAIEDMQKRTIEAWRHAAYKAVDAQAEMLLGTVRERPSADAESLVRHWTDAQREMWQGWLAVAGRPAQGGGAPPDVAGAGREMVESLREAAERLVKSQSEWAKAWSTGAAPPPRNEDEEPRGGP